MKTFLVAMGIIALCGCRIEKDIQMELVRAELIKIDTVYRHPNEMQLLTWKDMDNIRFTTFAAFGQSYIVGTQVLVMKQR